MQDTCTGCPYGEIDRCHEQALRLDEEEAFFNAIDAASSEEEVGDLLADLFAKLDE